MDVTLHLGAHRSGTGSLLGALMANLGPLSGAGIALWQADIIRDLIGHDGARVRDRVTVSEERRTRHALARLTARQREMEREGSKRLLVFAPDVLGTPENCWRTGVLYPEAGARMARVAPAFAGRCDRVVLSIRGGERWWTSIMAQALLRGEAPKSDSALDRIVTHPRHWRHVVEEAAAAFPNAKIVVWPSEVLADLPERQIVAMTGDAEGPLLTPYRAAPDRTPKADHLQRLLEKRGTPCRLPRDESGNWSPFNTLQTDALVAQYQNTLAWLAAGAEGHAAAIGLEGADLLALDRPIAVSQQGADHDQPQTPLRLGGPRPKRTARSTAG